MPALLISSTGAMTLSHASSPSSKQASLFLVFLKFFFFNSCLRGGFIHCGTHSVADPDPGSGAFLTPGPGSQTHIFLA